MKPGKRDIKVSILITGQELDELQKHTWSMAESFGLDRRIDNYPDTGGEYLHVTQIACNKSS